MATKTAINALKLIPTVGEFLSEVVNGVNERITTGKEIADEVAAMKERLPDFLSKLEKTAVDVDDSSSVKALIQTVEDFKKYVDEWKPPRKRDTYLRALCSGPTEYDAFKDRLRAFDNELQRVALQIAVETSNNVTKLSHHITKQFDQQRTENVKRFDSVRNGVRRVEVMLTTRSEVSKNHVSIAKGEWRAALIEFKVTDETRRNKAKRTLLEWLECGIHKQDAVEVSRVFVHRGDEESVAVGLSILLKMTEDARMWKELLKTDAIIVALLDVMHRSQIGAFQEDASRCLINLLDGEPDAFFKQWRKTRSPITNVRLIARIASRVRINTRINQRKMPVKFVADEAAVDVMVKLAMVNDSKIAIAHAGGIAALAKIYTKTSSIGNGDLNPMRRNLKVINALASLSTNADCRMKFAEDHTTVMPLLDFVWESSSHSVVDYMEDIEGSELLERRYSSPFYDSRDSHDEWLQSESNAGEALLQLASEKRCTEVFLKLGTFVDLEDGLFVTQPNIPIKSFHGVLGWLALAFKVAKNKEVARTLIITEVWLLRIAWLLFSHEDIKTIIADSRWVHLDGKRRHAVYLTYLDNYEPAKIHNIFDYDQRRPSVYEIQLQLVRVLATCEALTARNHPMEHFWVAHFLLSVLDWDIAGKSTHKRMVQLAAHSLSVLINCERSTLINRYDGCTSLQGMANDLVSCAKSSGCYTNNMVPDFTPQDALNSDSDKNSDSDEDSDED